MNTEGILLASMNILHPAYTLEHIGFEEPIKNKALKEIIPRVVAVVAPIFYAFQVVLYTVPFALSIVPTLANSSGMASHILGYSAGHLALSTGGLISSILEMPEKLLFGSRRTPNYFNIPGRYARKDLELNDF